MRVRVCGGSLSQLITTIHYFPYRERAGQTGEGWAGCSSREAAPGPKANVVA